MPFDLLPIELVDTSNGAPGQMPKVSAAGDRLEYADAGGVESIVEGAGISVDATDPANPVVSATGGGGGGGTYTGVKAYRSAAYSMVNNAVTAFPWDIEDWDTDGFHDNTTNNTRLTVPSGLNGRYQVSAAIAVSTPASGAMRYLVGIRKNGSDIRGGREDIYVSGGVGAQPSASVGTVIDLAVGDWVDVIYYQNGGSASADVSLCALEMHKIG